MFVNCTEEALLSGLVKVLPASHTVLELLETLEPTEALVKVCRELKSQGYRLALDDFENKPEWRPLLELADYVKIDFSQTTIEQRAEMKRRIGGLPVRLVIERVETPADLALARSEGFTLFQGYYFCRPVLMENRDIPPNRLVYLDLMKAVLKLPLDIKLVSGLVKRDPSLTYRLLRMANSPLYATRKEITSIHSALVLVGDEMFRRMVILATACEFKGNHPSELLRMAFLRGRFCELASPISGQDATEQYLLGILSLVPTMLSVPMESIVKALPLRNEVRKALLGENNAERRVLDWLICHEQGNWKCSDHVAEETGLAAEMLPPLYAEALVWAEENMRFAGK
jgi:EAL and modified HD-GYP domain-containing signal transduction protein